MGAPIYSMDELMEFSELHDRTNEAAEELESVFMKIQEKFKLSEREVLYTLARVSDSFIRMHEDFCFDPNCDLNAEAAFNDYYSVADDKAKSSELYTTMQRYIYFASDVASIRPLSFQIVAQKVFYEGGYEAAVKFINSEYSPVENEREMGKSYREWLVKAALEYASQANIYKDSGCKFVNWSIDYSCQKNITGETATLLKNSISFAGTYTQKSDNKL
jgi:hypothetical protein